MPSVTPAIMLMPKARGWAWELVDANGMTTVAGVSAYQEDAMQSAWCAARSELGFEFDGFPEIRGDRAAGSRS
jgi:hypothetical protein